MQRYIWLKWAGIYLATYTHNVLEKPEDMKKVRRFENTVDNGWHLLLLKYWLSALLFLKCQLSTVFGWESAGLRLCGLTLFKKGLEGDNRNDVNHDMMEKQK